MKLAKANRKRRSTPTKHPLRVPLQDLPSLVASSPIVVVYADDAPPLEPDLVLWCFGHVPACARWVDTRTTKATADGALARWLREQGARVGRSERFGPGYYLFVGGAAHAYHAGTLDVSGDWISAGAAIATAWVGSQWRRRELIDVVPGIAMAQARLRVVAAFMHALETAAAPTTPPPAPPPPPADPLGVAFAVLGVPVTAAQDVAKARYRALAKEWHPDRFANDPVKAAQAHARMAQINGAYAAICASRGW